MCDTPRDSNYMVIGRKLQLMKEMRRDREWMGWGIKTRLTPTYSPWQAQLRLSYKLQFNSPGIFTQQW